jgi:HEAT repeat protein
MHRSPILWLALTVGLSATAVSCTHPVAQRPSSGADDLEGLTAQLRHADWQKRADAARKLGDTRRPGAVAILSGGSGDRDKRVRVAVIRALARVGTRPAAEAMIAVLDGASMWLRPEVADGLARLSAKVLAGLEVAAQIFVAELNPAQEARFVRLAAGLVAVGKPGLEAIRALGKLTTPRARGILKRLAGSPHKGLAKAAGGVSNPKTTSKLGITLIGIPECDRYLAVFACYVSRLPSVAQGPVTAAFQKTLSAYRKMAAGPARSSLGKSCKTALAAWKKAMSLMPMFKSCFAP